MSKKIEDILSHIDLLYYEYNKKQNTLFVDTSGSKDDISREFLKITYALSKNDIEFFIDDERSIIIACEDKLLTRLKHKYTNFINKIKNNGKKIYILSDKKIKYAKNIPMIDIQYIPQSIDLEKYDALIFTSKNAIHALNSMDTTWKKIPTYAIAPQSAKVIKSLGGNLAFTGKEKHGDEFAYEIREKLKEKKVLYVGGTKVVSNLLGILNKSGIDCDNVAVYKTVCKEYTKKINLPKRAIIIFSSPSTVECFLKNINWRNTFQAVSIGHTTAKYFPDYIEPHIAETTSLESCVKKAQELDF